MSSAWWGRAWCVKFSFYKEWKTSYKETTFKITDIKNKRKFYGRYSSLLNSSTRLAAPLPEMKMEIRMKNVSEERGSLKPLTPICVQRIWLLISRPFLFILVFLHLLVQVEQRGKACVWSWRVKLVIKSFKIND